MKGNKKFNQEHFNQHMYLKNINFPVKLTIHPLATNLSKQVDVMNTEFCINSFLYLHLGQLSI